MGGRSIPKRPEPAKKLNLLLSEPRDVGECLGSAKHRKQAQQQNLVERIGDFAALARVRHILEMV